MSMAISCAGARLHGRIAVGGPKCRVGAAALVWRRGSCFCSNARRWSVARGARSELPPPPPPQASADGGAAVAIPEAVDVVADSSQQVGAVAQPGVLPERHGKAGGADVDDGAGGNGKLPPGGGGGDGDNSWGGGGGDGDGAEDEFGPILSFEQVVQEAEKRGVSLPSLPSDMVETAKSVGIQKLLLLRYLDLQASVWPLGPAIRSCSLIRNRMLVDPAFLFKIGTEIVIDTCCATFAEVQKRGEEFWSEFELYAADMLVGVVVNVALVGMLAPYARFGGRSASEGLLGRVRHAYDALPSSVFEAERPGYRFSVQQRIGTYFFKGILYGTVGFFCGLVGQGIANLIMTAKRSVKKSEDDIPVPPLLKTSALWGAFLAVSSNTRYQIINGLERVVEASPISKRVPAASLAFTVGVRFANNVYGGMQFVDWARMSGCQ
ncbi:protein RETICULATA-RELATED 1, chloroplastic-like [Phragmites australis]|uniref:protein RETICULATA-RELATED 1, chloroplastic-like n=1 Tax=Phragmites australis TaxID=29695 RepID=UPI002D7871F9|nr:protein RETICULATA-RELATED 1, chloroplastic-like [Phragmites australis]XP_062188211.1 protein RETICULATA-RELATED 1, chloroplastic-like [Phragmites australis]XP_062188212.1 protein RETICULATA-RELATED 1, chloroplastic-like [Phragmites australis]XP_062188213.1 protein RETICULATA-RELATED 1, chloroplastic-like [Phragmites australis]